MKYIKKLLFLIFIMLFSANAYASEEKSYAEQNITCEDLGNGDITSKIIAFENGDVFNISKLSPYADNSFIENEIFIPGENIRISFFDSEDNFVTQYTYENLPTKTLFIETSECNAVISIGAVYNKDVENNTIVPVKEKEQPLIAKAIINPERGYVFKGSFNLDLCENGEIWYLLSKDIQNPIPFIAKDDEFTINSLKINKFHDNKMRLCYDGYYFESSTSYLPYRKDMLFRQPACYTGVSFARYSKCRLFNQLGYAMLMLSAQTINEYGYWETNPYVNWLKEDFNIKNDFYDTRFNTDFATGLVVTYDKYKDSALLEYAFKYTEYFIKHTEKNHIAIGDGWLIRDYAPKSENIWTKQTHSSLNHHLAEIVFLNELYDVIYGFDTNEYEMFNEYEFVRNPEIISGLAEKMLRGVENTEKYWVMSDGNLKYAYGYNGKANVMTDYPYLTYNDLFTLNKQIKKKTGISNPVLERLMENKKAWMDNNQITGYLTM